MRVVVDASLVLAWFLPELPEPKALANSFLLRLRELDGVAVVPGIFHYEVAALLRRSLAAKRLLRPQFDAALAMLRDMWIETHGTQLDTEGLCKQAERLGCQVRDSAYVELARVEVLELISLDGGMLQAARAAKVRIWQP